MRKISSSERLMNFPRLHRTILDGTNEKKKKHTIRTSTGTK